MNKAAKIFYEAASPSDYGEILALNEAAIPAVNRIDEADLATLHAQALSLTVARADDHIAGFLLTLDETARYASENYQYFKGRYERFVYVDRIVVNMDCRRMGIGAGLYDMLLATTDPTVTITCEVNLEPPNPGSLAFHRELGFTIVDEQETECGRKRVALMARPGSKL